jgi:translocation and assembly module TamB
MDGLSDPKRGQFNFVLETERGLELEATLASEFTRQSLNGQVSIKQLQFNHFRSLFVDIEQLSGVVNGELAISGDYEAPLLHGQLALSEGTLLLFANPTALSDVALTAEFDGQQAAINSSFSMGAGKGKFDAALDWREQMVVNASLQGEKLHLLLPPDSELNISPDLKLNWLTNNLEIKGEIVVPEASLVYRTLPAGSIDISDDEVFIDQSEELKQHKFDIQTKVQLRLGNRVEVDALGLVGRLEGQMEIQHSSGAPLQLYGPLRLVSGRYRAYGQKLVVQPGAAINFNGPIGLGVLDIKAARENKDENILAGLHATGTVDQPIVTLFSEPTLEQQEILSYIIRGRGLDADQNNQTMGAATSLGVAALSSTGITEAVEQISGISQLELSTDGQGDDTQVTISGYAGERLYVKYGVGVFLPINELTVRFYLLNQLWLETVSGLEQSIDIYYSFFIE